MTEGKEPTIKLDELGDALNEIENLSSEERFQLLTNFIGGFEKWSQLNEDFRIHVAQFLDYQTMCKLERCSKKDQLTVKDAPVRMFDVCVGFMDHIQLEEIGPELDTIYVEARFDFPSIGYSVDFYQDGENVIQQSQGGKEIRTIESSDYCQEAIKFAEGIIRKGRMYLEHLRIHLKNYPFENSLMKTLPRCKIAHIGVLSKDEMRWWLQWLPEDNLNVWTSTYEGNTKFALILSSEELYRQLIRNAEQLLASTQNADAAFLSLCTDFPRQTWSIFSVE